MILGALSLFVGDTSFLIGSIVLGAFIGWLYGRWVDSSVWSRTPYWFRGGIMVSVMILAVVLLDLRCENSAMKLFTESGGLEDFSDFKCLPLNWPSWPLEILVPTWNRLSTVFYVSLVTLIWFIVGSIIGVFVGLFKNKKSPSIR